MFTSRAEYRLTLRADNADRRLTPKGQARGVVGAARARSFAAKAAALTAAEARLRELQLSPTAARRAGLPVKLDGTVRDGLELLRLPEITVAALARVWPELHALRADVVEQLEIEARYASYLVRQNSEIAVLRAEEALALPQDLDLAAIEGLSSEIRARLAAVRPATLAAAGRLPGMTPAALALLYRHARRAA
jgi:tRNA uridine 5-carboxymethylaminomethyl modification enzyme